MSHKDNCGKVGKDDAGNLYIERMEKEGVHSDITQGDGMTGIAISFITPDGEYVCTLSSGGVAIEGGSVDGPSGLLVMDSAYNWIHEIRLGDYAEVNSLAFK